MSRAYDILVECNNVPGEYLNSTMEEFGWEEVDEDENKDYAYFSGTGALCGGKSEEEEHEEISKKIKKDYPKALVRTRLTYLEDLPYEEYGDDVKAGGVEQVEQFKG